LALDIRVMAGRCCYRALVPGHNHRALEDLQSIGIVGHFAGRAVVHMVADILGSIAGSTKFLVAGMEHAAERNWPNVRGGCGRSCDGSSRGGNDDRSVARIAGRGRDCPLANANPLAWAVASF